MNATCELTAAAPRFERAAWPKHRNFPNHLLLLGSHKNFRSISKTLVTRARVLAEEPSPHWRDDTLYLFNWWQSGMKSHEHYEERKLYPYLSEHYCVSLGTLIGDHGDIDDQRDVVARAIASGDASEIRRALEAFDTILVRHLADEEDLVIPMLLDLEPDEFREFSFGAPARSRSCSSCR